MLVRIQPSALPSRWCSGRHGTLRRSRSWFDSRSGYYYLASVTEARQSTKLQDEVRLLGEVSGRQATDRKKTQDRKETRNPPGLRAIPRGAMRLLRQAAAP